MSERNESEEREIQMITTTIKWVYVIAKRKYTNEWKKI